MNILECASMLPDVRTESSEMTDTAASITFRRIFRSNGLKAAMMYTERKLNKFGIIYTNTKRYDDCFSGPMPCAMAHKTSILNFNFHFLFISHFPFPFSFQPPTILAFRLNFQSDHLIKSVV